MHDRIVQLERLVMSLIPGPVFNSVPGPSPDPGPTPEPDPGLNPVPGAGPASHAMAAPAETAPSAVEVNAPIDVGSECGSMRVSASELRYVGGDHWTAILDGIADLKDHFDQEERFRLAQDEHDTGAGDETTNLLEPHSTPTLLLYGCRLPVSRAEILAALPPKSAVDRYISRYFNRLDLVHCLFFYCFCFHQLFPLRTCGQ